MISFRDAIRLESTDDKIAYVATRIAAEDGEGLFVEAGELEQAILDRVEPVRDGWGPLQRRLRRLSGAAAGAYRAQRTGQEPARSFHQATEALRDLHGTDLPPDLEVRPPEGYTHYALDPLGYARAARDYLDDVGPRQASRAVVLGIRSVGTGLSAMVAAELGARRSVTVRPRGRSGSRTVAVTDGLSCMLLEWLADGGEALLVDEGPGATGETFHRVAAWLVASGVAAERIVLFPSGLQLPGLAPAERREFFLGSRRYPPPEDDSRIDAVCARFGLEPQENLSGGGWRQRVPCGESVPAVAIHERVKILAHDGDGRQYLIRYGGLGRAGAEAGLRLRCLAAAGLGPESIGWSGGFEVIRWVVGEAVAVSESSRPEFRTSLAAYLATRLPLFPTGRAVDVEPLLTMLDENAREALGACPAGLGDAQCRLRRLPRREAHVVDGRLHAREWIRTLGGHTKVDANDHGDGVRMPGPVDAAWDLAGAAVEFGLTRGEFGELVDRCRMPGTKLESGLAEAADAYRAPYAAAQLGEMAVSAGEVAGTTDGTRLQLEAERYRALLRRELLRAAAIGVFPSHP